MSVHGDDARGRGDHRRRGARDRGSTACGDHPTLALDTHEYGLLNGGVLDLMVTGKSSGNEAVRRRATDYDGHEDLRRAKDDKHDQENRKLTLDA